MKDAEQLANSLYQLKKKEEFDININIPVAGKAYDECIALNKIIKETNNSPVFFNADRLIFPHITLKMGTVNRGCFENILNKLDGFTGGTEAIELTLQPVILKEPAKKYYFGEIDEQRLLDLSNDLDKLLSGDMKAPRFPLSQDNLHHVTLGYKYPDDPEIAPVIGKMISAFTADRIQVSVMGKFGVCIGVLKTFYLKNK